MREDLKGQNLTFTEIAKLVGENWQGLTQAEKEPYERQAQAAKEKYNQDLAEYKKTPEYKKYLQYLQDFKAKHAGQPQGQCTQLPNGCTGTVQRKRKLTHHSTDKENTKRVRLSDTSASESSGAVGHLIRGGRASSIGEGTVEPAVRRQRIGSIVSNGDSYYAPSILSASQPTPGEDFSVTSPGGGYFDRRREHSPSFAMSPKGSSAPPPTIPLRKDLPYIDGSRNETGPVHRPLPSLSDIFDGRPPPSGVPHTSEVLGPNFGMLPRGHQTSSPAHTPSNDSRPPSLRKEQSSATSMSSGSSYSGFPTPRTPIEGPLPIHALLSGGKPFGSQETAIYRSMSPDDRGQPVHYPLDRPPSDSTTPSGLPAPHTTNGELTVFDTGLNWETNEDITGIYPGHAILPPHTSAAPITRLAYPVGYNDNRPGPPQVSSSGPSPVSVSAQVPAPALASVTRPSGRPDAGLDGISALLQADKFVDRR